MNSGSQYSQIKEILYPNLNKKSKNNKLIIRNLKHIKKLQTLNRLKKHNNKFPFDECKS